MYNPKPRRVHPVDNGHCLIVYHPSYHYHATENYRTLRVFKAVDCKRTATNESISDLIWGSEFPLVHDHNSKSKLALRFISPTNGYEWTIDVRSTLLIVSDKIQERVDRFEESALEIVNNHASYMM